MSQTGKGKGRATSPPWDPNADDADADDEQDLRANHGSDDSDDSDSDDKATRGPKISKNQSVKETVLEWLQNQPTQRVHKPKDQQRNINVGLSLAHPANTLT